MSHQWAELLDITVALGLCAVVGLERQWRQKSAGLRTHTLVGVGSALFMVVSKWGFFDVIGHGVTLDPSRIAAQVVSGIGFLGGGLIFVRRDLVRGLTTAATVWLAAAIGMAAGAGLLTIAAFVTVLYLIISLGFPILLKRVPGKFSSALLRVTYEDGRGLLRTIVQVCTASGNHVVDLELIHHTDARAGQDDARPVVDLLLELEGPRNTDQVLQELGDIDGVVAVRLAEGARDE